MGIGISAAAVAAYAGVASAVVGVAGIVASGEAQSNAANYQAQVARNNAITEKQNADYAIAAGTQKAQTESLKGAAAGGRLKAAQAANGIDVNSGSAVDVQAGQRAASTLDTLNVSNESLLAAYGYRTAATNEEAKAGLEDAAADQAITGAALGATGTLLGDASSLGFKWSGSQNPSANAGMGLKANNISGLY